MWRDVNKEVDDVDDGDEVDICDNVRDNISVGNAYNTELVDCCMTLGAGVGVVGDRNNNNLGGDRNGDTMTLLKLLMIRFPKL